MTGSITEQNNPYIIGRPIYESECFFGREDLFQFIRDNLKKDAKVILLHGQRRIGKSSVLSQLANFIELEQFIFVPLSLEGKSRKPLSDVLSELAVDIKDYLEDELELSTEQINIPSKQAWQNNQEIFASDFLPQVYEVIHGKNLVLLLDEFDVLENSAQDTAVAHFFPYLKSILDEQEKLDLQEPLNRQKKLFILPVVGRRLEDMPNLLSLFRQAPNQKIGLLQKRNAKRLIIEPAKGILEYDSDAIQAILELSAGHPYFTQIICFAIFLKAREEKKLKVIRADVESVVDKAIEIGEAGLAWFRDGLPIPERVIFSAVAESQDQGNIEAEETKEFFKIFQDYGVIATEQLKLAVERLIEWEFIERVEAPESSSQKFPEYKVKVELVRYWLLKQHPLRRAILELEKVNSEANRIHNLATELRQNQELFTSAIAIYEEVLTVNPNHFKALFELAELYLDAKNFDKAVKLYTRAYQVEPLRFQENLVRSLLNYEVELKQKGKFELAKEQVKKVLAIESDNATALEKLKNIEAERRLIIGGRYKIIDILGEREFKETYLAEDTHLPENPRCIVKKLQLKSNEKLSLETARRLFNNEAQVLYKLNEHQKIPRLLAHLEVDGQFYLVNEFIEGKDLGQEEIIPGHHWTEEKVIFFLKDVLEILAFVHQNNFIHRNLKPSNLIRRVSDNKIVLIDFGLVKQVSIEAQTTVVVGTESFMPVEQMMGHPGFYSDIYAVGTIAIQALTGVIPEKLPVDQDGELIWRNKLNHKYKYNPQLLNLLDKMVRYRFQERFQNVNEVLQNLQSLTRPVHTLHTISKHLPLPASNRVERYSKPQSVLLKRLLRLTLLPFVLVSVLLGPRIVNAFRALNYYKQGNILIDAQKYQEAISAFDRAIKIKPDFAQAWINKGYAQGNLGLYLEKFASCAQATEVQPDFADAWNCRGEARLQAKQYEQALQEYNQAIAIDPNLYRGLLNKGQVLLKLGRPEEAINVTRQILEIKPNYFLAWTQICQGLFELQQYQDAKASCEESLQLNPDYQPTVELYNKVQSQLEQNKS